MTIRAKLILSFILMVMFTVILGIVTFVQVNKLSVSQDKLVNNLLPKVIAVEKIIINETRTQQYIREYILLKEAAAKQKRVEVVAENRKANKSLTDYLKETIKSEQGKKLLAGFEKKHDELVVINNRIVSLDEQGDTEQAIELLASDDAKQARRGQRDALQKLVDYQKKLANDSGQQGLATSDNTKMLTMILLGLSIIASVLLVLFILKSVVRPINYMKQVMLDVVKNGDFKHKISIGNRDEIGEALMAFDGLLRNLEQAIDETNNVVGAVARGQFDQRVTAELQGDLAQLKQGVNDSAESVDFTMKELAKVMAALQNGDFSTQVNIDAKMQGQYREMMEAMMATTQTLNGIISEILMVMGKMEAGQFQDDRVNIEAHGDLETLKLGINKSLDILSNAIQDVTRVVVAQSQGDLTMTINADYQGDLDVLKQAVNTSAARLKETVSQAMEASNIVSSASLEVSKGAQDLSQRVQEQAAALEETSATMNEMNSAVQTNTENAQNASKVAEEVSGKASDGTGVMQQTIEAMNSIQESSHKIAEIVTLIDGIAFQTNLLALNAAVEAARAGDHGRGFAVVAGEVRALAQKAAEAARDIKSLIEESVTRIDQGTELASQSGEMLEAINTSVEEVTKMIAQIAHASSEQTEGISQVHQAISQIDQVTQQNAALVEETTAASESMSEQADALSQNMAFFNTGAKTLLSAPKSEVKSLAEKQKTEDKTEGKTATSSQALKLKAPEATSSHDEWGEF
ncbi:MAG: methyl-accepting chemotaxis protein [Hydrogenovibrio sp.]|nr:methyl-accepting chemotaxis protein [Hydrogenovibrio sp.]